MPHSFTTILLLEERRKQATQTDTGGEWETAQKHNVPKGLDWTTPVKRRFDILVKLELSPKKNRTNRYVAVVQRLESRQTQPFLLAMASYITIKYDSPALIPDFLEFVSLWRKDRGIAASESCGLKKKGTKRVTLTKVFKGLTTTTTTTTMIIIGLSGLH